MSGLVAVNITATFVFYQNIFHNIDAPDLSSTERVLFHVNAHELNVIGV